MRRQPIDVKDDFVTKLWRVVIYNLSKKCRHSGQGDISNFYLSESVTFEAKVFFFWITTVVLKPIPMCYVPRYDIVISQGKEKKN